MPGLQVELAGKGGAEWRGEVRARGEMTQQKQQRWRADALTARERVKDPISQPVQRSRQQSCNYNDPMLAIRYVTLAALVVWLGGLVALGMLMMPSTEDLRRLQLVGYACGAIIFVGLLVIKFIGPPPHDFFRRIGVVAAMMFVALYAGMRPQDWLASLSPAVNIGLGFVLLFWYVRE